MTLDEYLRQPCDNAECDRTATHNQAGRKVCNAHLDRNERAFARDD